MSEPGTVNLTSQWLESQKTSFQSIIATKLGAGDMHAVDDVWQELSLAVEKTIRQNKSIEDPRAWVRQIINHKVADYLRSKQRSQRLEQKITAIPVSDTIDPTPFDWVLQLEDRQHVQLALSKCSSENREILRLKYFCDAKVAEIAATLNISSKAAEYRLHRAKQEFRQHIKQYIEK